MRKKLGVLLFGLALALSGCGKKGQEKELVITVDDYERITYETAEAVYGDICPVLNLRLTADSFDRSNCFPALVGMEADQIYVKEGDVVHAGDVMLTFKAGDLDKEKEAYQNQMDETALLIEHYENLAKLQNTDEYKDSIEELKQEQQIASMYVQELQAKIDSYSIKAEKDGVVVMVSELLTAGEVNPNNPVITLIYGSDDYKAVTNDDMDFKIGDTFTATYGVASYDMVLTAVEETGKDSEGNVMRELTFTLAEGQDKPSSENINMVIEKPVLKNVLYVPATAVFAVEDKTYVYVLDENQFRRGVEVKVGGTVDGFTVIEAGLNQGDKVVTN